MHKRAVSRHMSIVCVSMNSTYTHTHTQAHSTHARKHTQRWGSDEHVKFDWSTSLH